MPLMSLFIAFQVPAAVGIYWMFNSVFSILQIIALAKLMPLPTFTEEQLRQYEKEMKVSRSRRSTSAAPQRVVRSRHHIDDDDYDSLPTLPSAEKKTKPSGGIQAAPQKKDGRGKQDH